MKSNLQTAMEILKSKLYLKVEVKNYFDFDYFDFEYKINW